MSPANKSAAASFDFQKLGREVITTELAEIKALQSRIDESFNRACEILLNCKGRIVVTGMGKSGHIGSKLAATDRKSTRLNSSHLVISYAVFCLKKKKNK